MTRKRCAAAPRNRAPKSRSRARSAPRGALLGGPGGLGGEFGALWAPLGPFRGTARGPPSAPRHNLALRGAGAALSCAVSAFGWWAGGRFGGELRAHASAGLPEGGGQRTAAQSPCCNNCSEARGASWLCSARARVDAGGRERAGYLAACPAARGLQNAQSTARGSIAVECLQARRGRGCARQSRVYVSARLLDLITTPIRFP
eukprot:scaffold2535_cov336-Prasinococcus_capsulatus_cf.AAC.5